MIVLRRGTDRFCKTPLTYWPVKIYSREHLTANVVCANSHGALLSVVHRINDDGTVAPSVVCPEKGCGWHEHVRLEDWPPG